MFTFLYLSKSSAAMSDRSGNGKKGKQINYINTLLDNNNFILVDPGWNDPPMLHYSPENPPPKSRIKNIRVAYPIAATTSNAKTPVPPSSWDSNMKFKEIEEIVNKLLDVKEQNKDFEMMKCMWKTGQFPTDCQMKIWSLFHAFLKKDTNEVNRLETELLNQYRPLCEPWIASFKLLFV